MSNTDYPNGSIDHYLKGGGEMGELIRSFDWKLTPLGPPENWPLSLLITVSILLQSRFPMFLWWGPQLVQFYNDAYRPSLGTDGKHPKALGQFGEDCWPEIWPVIKPLIDQVMANGESVWFENQLVPIFRNGRLEDVYWTFSYSRVTGEYGEPAGVLVICNETTASVLVAKRLRKSEKRFRFMLNAIPQHVWTARPDGMLDYVNRVVLDELGKTAREIIASGWQVFIHPDDLPGCLRAWYASIKSGKEYVCEFRVLFKDGTYKWHLCRALPLVEDGEIRFWLGTNTNIELQKNNEQRKEEFISIASHELKTPITSVKASLQLVQRLNRTGASPDKVNLLMDKANKNLDKIVELLDDLMNDSKIQRGQLALHKTRFNLAALVDNCCDYVRFDKNHQLIVQGDKDLFVFADQSRIEQVMVNLINNAVKYAPQSKRIEISVDRDGENATVSVRDFGIGISPEKLPHIFDRYYRVASSETDFSGLGLGLYISSEIIKRHGGKMGVASKLGEGSVFWFTLPL